MHFLRQSTASQVVPFGPFIDDTDFKTPETGLTIANTDIKIIQAGAATSKNSGGATARGTAGMYEATFDATDTATVGRASLAILMSGALVVTKEITILEEAVYDALFASGAAAAMSIGSGGITTSSFAAGAINAAAIADAAIDAATYATDALEVLGVIARGTAGNVTSGGTSIVLTGLDFSADTNIVGATVKLRATGTGKGQTRSISAWVNSTATATVDRAWTSAATAPTYDLYAGPPAPTTAPDVNMASTTAGAITSSSFAASAIDNAAIATDAIGSAEIAASAVTEIQSGLATAAAQAAAATEIDAIYTVIASLGTGFPRATNAIGYGTVTTGATTTSVPTSAMSPAGAVADQFKNRTLVFANTTTTTALRSVAVAISASSNSATPTFTVATLPATPASGDIFVVV